MGGVEQRVQRDEKKGFSYSIPLCPSMFIHDPALFTRLADATPLQRKVTLPFVSPCSDHPVHVPSASHLSTSGRG